MAQRSICTQEIDCVHQTVSSPRIFMEVLTIPENTGERYPTVFKANRLPPLYFPLNIIFSVSNAEINHARSVPSCRGVRRRISQVKVVKLSSRFVFVPFSLSFHVDSESSQDEERTSNVVPRIRMRSQRGHSKGRRGCLPFLSKIFANLTDT